MGFINAEFYENAGVHTISVKSKDYFWVKMKDVGNGLGLKWLRGMVEIKFVEFMK